MAGGKKKKTYIREQLNHVMGDEYRLNDFEKWVWFPGPDGDINCYRGYRYAAGNFYDFEEHAWNYPISSSNTRAYVMTLAALRKLQNRLLKKGSIGPANMVRKERNYLKRNHSNARVGIQSFSGTSGSTDSGTSTISVSATSSSDNGYSSGSGSYS